MFGAGNYEGFEDCEKEDFVRRRRTVGPFAAKFLALVVNFGAHSITADICRNAFGRRMGLNSLGDCFCGSDRFAVTLVFDAGNSLSMWCLKEIDAILRSLTFEIVQQLCE
jgi:hypothetical protein